jgi:hypothetical protein
LRRSDGQADYEIVGSSPALAHWVKDSVTWYVALEDLQEGVFPWKSCNPRVKLSAGTRPSRVSAGATIMSETPWNPVGPRRTVALGVLHPPRGDAKAGRMGRQFQVSTPRRLPRSLPRFWVGDPGLRISRRHPVGLGSRAGVSGGSVHLHVTRSAQGWRGTGSGLRRIGNPDGAPRVPVALVPEGVGRASWARVTRLCLHAFNTESSGTASRVFQ